MAVCAAVVFAASTTRAQGIVYGAKAGINIADQKFTPEVPDVNFDQRFALAIGGFLTLPITGRLELQPEVLYSRKGTSLELEGQKTKVEIDYIDVPVLGTFRISGSTARGLKVVGGPGFGFRLRARAISEFDDSSVATKIDDEVKQVDIAAVAGASWQSGRWVVDGRYWFGFSDIDKDSDDDSEVRNRVISVLVGFRF